MKYLHCYYDMSVAPCSYDFFSFFMHCEIARIRRNLDHIFLHFIKGPKNEFRQDNLRSDSQNLTFFLNVIIPGLSVLKSCKKFEWVEREEISGVPANPDLIFPRGYHPQKPVADYVGNDFALSRVRGDLPGYFQAPPFAREFASQWISRFKEKKIVTLTVRELERDDVGGTRSIDKEIWETFFEYLKTLDFEPVVLRDTHYAFTGKKIFQNAVECPEGSLSVAFRLALYEASEYNFFKNNGPQLLAFFCDTRSADFLKFDNNVTALSENWFNNNFGMKIDCDYPMTRKKIKFVWKNEDVSLIKELFETRNTQNSQQLNDFYDLEHLALTIGVAMRKFLNDLTLSPLLAEDVQFMKALAKADDKFPNLKIPDLKELINKHSDQMFEKNLIDKVTQMLA